MISNILKEKGYLDFKPFSYGNKEVYCYRTKNESINEFHFCDSDLKELSRDDIGLPSGPIFVLGINEEYKILEEGCDVKDKLSYHKVCLLVDRNNIIRNFAVNGYVKLNDNYYVLESSLNLVDDTQKSGILKPNLHNKNYKGAYNSNKDYVFKDTMYGYYYYWSYKTFHILHGDGNFIVLSDNKEYIIPSFPELWITDGEVCNIVYLNKDNEKCYLNILDITTDKTNRIEFTPQNLKRYNYDDEEYIEPPYSGDSQFYADKNIICVVMQTRDQYDKINDSVYSNIYSYRTADQHLKSHYLNSTILIADKDRGYLYFYGNLGYNRKFISIDNGIITLDERFNITDLGYSYDNKKVFLDLDFNLLGETSVINPEYIVVSRTSRQLSSQCRAIVNDEHYTLKGVLNCHDKTMIVPIRYEYVEIIGDYAIVGNEYNICGKRHLLYGLLRLTDQSLIIPIQYYYLKYGNNTLTWVVGLLHGKGKNKRIRYGLIYNKELITEIKYDEIVHICYSGCMRYKRKGKYGLFYEGKKIFPAKYDSISTQDGYIILGKNGKKGVLSIPMNFISPVRFDNVKLIADDNIFIGDNNLYFIVENKLKCVVEGFGRLRYLVSKYGYHLFISVNSTDKYNCDNYECYKIDTSGNDIIVDIKKEYGPIRDEYGDMCDIRSGDYFSIDGGILFYEVNDNKFYEKELILDPPNYDYPDNYNYEEDTYYALGGNDYDRWKEEGGDIDSMMDGLGY